MFQLSEDLRDDKPLLTWMHLCEAMVMEGLSNCWTALTRRAGG